MKLTKFAYLAFGMLLSGTLVLPVYADNLLTPVINLSPGSPSYGASANNQIPNAWVYPGNPDVWQFNVSGYSPAVNVSLHVNDYYPPYPDDYNIYWDGNLLGNTMTAYPGTTFTFNTSDGLHLMEVEYVNIHTGWAPSYGGSWYSMSINTAVGTAPFQNPNHMPCCWQVLA